MEVRLNYEIQNKQLDHERAEQQEARQERVADKTADRTERKEWRKCGLWIAGGLILLMAVAMFRGGEASVLELIKLLGLVLAAMFATHYHGKYKSLEKQQRKAKSADSKDDQDED